MIFPLPSDEVLFRAGYFFTGIISVELHFAGGVDSNISNINAVRQSFNKDEAIHLKGQNRSVVIRLRIDPMVSGASPPPAKLSLGLKRFAISMEFQAWES